MTNSVALIPDSVALNDDTSRSRKTMDTGPMCRTVWLFTPPPYAASKLRCLVTEQMCVCEQISRGHMRQCSGWDLIRDLWSQVQRRNHSTTDPSVLPL